MLGEPVMDRTFVTLDRPQLLAAVVELLAIAHVSTATPATTAEAAIHVGEIPASLRNSSRNAIGAGTVRLTGEEAVAYNRLREHLTRLRETEWLRTDDLDEHLWTLVCDLALNPRDYATPEPRAGHAEAFLRQVLRPLRPYEVLITIEHLTPPAAPVPVWDTRVVVGTAELLAPFVSRVTD